MPRPQFTLRALLVALLVVAAFFGGIQFERERRSREDAAAALAARNAQRAEAAARTKRRMAVIATELDLEAHQIAAEQEARERINRELLLQQQKADQLMARFNALMDEERHRSETSGASNLLLRKPAK